MKDFNKSFAAAPLPGDPQKRAEITAEKFLALAARELPCGFYTLTLTDGSKKRFRVRLERGKFCTGQRTLSRYCKIESGGDAEREWETIAVVSATGFNLFKRWRGEWEERWATAIWSLTHGQDAQGYSLAIEPRCWMTMRQLKDENKSVGLCETWRKRFEL